MNAVNVIKWQVEDPLIGKKPVTFLLGDLLMRTKV
jgi:hypothetical protein